MFSKEKQIVLKKLFAKTAMSKRTAKSRGGGGEKGGNSNTATTSEGQTQHGHNTRNRRKPATSEGILQENPTHISLVNNYVAEPCDGTVPLDDMSSQLKPVTQKGPEAVGSQPWNNPVARLQEIGSKTSCPIPWARLCLQSQEEQESDFGLNFEEWRSGNGLSSGQLWSVYG